MEDFEIEFLDHVAIRVKDLEASAKWYSDVYGLKRYQLEKWGAYPVFLLAGKAGIALFPADDEDPSIDPLSKNVKIDHFAFNVTRNNFDKAIRKFEALNIPFEVKNHHYFESVYVSDPDGHIVELTTILVDENEFYR